VIYYEKIDVPGMEPGAEKKREALVVPPPAAEFQVEAPATAPQQEMVTPREAPEAQIPKEEKESAIERAVGGLQRMVRRPKKTPPPLPQIRDTLTLQVEKIMEEHIGDAYRALSPVKQQEFKIAGERTAYAIRTLLAQTHVKIKKVFKLLLAWLILLPGVNRYFLEQEAKIKADKILAIRLRQPGE
jgi:hypothetical protein